MKAEAQLDRYRGGTAHGSRVARCPECGAPLGIHEFRDGVYGTTTIGRRFTKLGDKLYGVSDHSRGRSLLPPSAQAVMFASKAPLDIHCPTPRCGRLKVHLATPTVGLVDSP